MRERDVLRSATLSTLNCFFSDYQLSDVGFTFRFYFLKNSGLVLKIFLGMHFK